MKNIVYFGAFLTPRSATLLKLLAKQYGKPLARDVANKHITFAFRPQEIPSCMVWGTKLKIAVYGYANNGKNEGFIVSLKPEIDLHPEIRKYVWDNVACPHITMSLSADALAKDTGRLEFSFLDGAEFPIVEARLGYFDGKSIRFK